MAAAGDCKGSSAVFTEVVLVRHGETLWNASRILQGHIDSELNDIGRQQAVAVASHLSKEKDFVAIYSSDLQRAAETAQIIASSCNLPEVILDPSLRERHLGDLQGLTIKDAKKQKPIAFKHLLSAKRDQELPGGGESLVQLHERCASFLEKLAKKHEGERIIVVTHGGVLRELYRRACPKGPLKGNIKNASVNVIHMHEKGLKWAIKRWGDVGHLQGVGVIEEAFGGDRTSDAGEPTMKQIISILHAQDEMIKRLISELHDTNEMTKKNFKAVFFQFKIVIGVIVFFFVYFSFVRAERLVCKV